MINVVLVIQFIVTILMITVIMIQKSEGGGLGIGGSRGGMGDFLGAKGTANLLTRVTTVLATLFMVLSIVLAILFSQASKDTSSIIDKIVTEKSVAPIENSSIEEEQAPAEEAVIDIVEEKTEASEAPVSE